MSIFDLHTCELGVYNDFINSFVNVADAQLRGRSVQQYVEQCHVWTEISFPPTPRKIGGGIGVLLICCEMCGSNKMHPKQYRNSWERNSMCRAQYSLTLMCKYVKALLLYTWHSLTLQWFIEKYLKTRCPFGEMPVSSGNNLMGTRPIAYCSLQGRGSLR